jgi:hypothetical protein
MITAKLKQEDRHGRTPALRPTAKRFSPTTLRAQTHARPLDYLPGKLVKSLDGVATDDTGATDYCNAHRNLPSKKL